MRNNFRLKNPKVDISVYEIGVDSDKTIEEALEKIGCSFERRGEEIWFDTPEGLGYLVLKPNQYLVIYNLSENVAVYSKEDFDKIYEENN